MNYSNYPSIVNPFAPNNYGFIDTASFDAKIVVSLSSQVTTGVLVLQTGYELPESSFKREVEALLRDDSSEAW